MDLSQLASLLVVGALLAAVGRGITGMVFPEGIGPTQVAALPWKGPGTWRRVFYMTMWAHPIVVGALLGVPHWLPAPAFMDADDHRKMAGRVIWYAVSGVFSSVAYYRMEGAIKGTAERKVTAGETTTEAQQ